MKKILKLIIPLSLACFFIIGCNAKEEKTEIIISAAASLNEVLNEIKDEFMSEYPKINITCNFGSSGSLQKQIEQGAPCDVFFSAAESNMTELNDNNLIEDGTMRTFVTNSLVLVAPKNSTITSINDLTSNKVTHIAIGEISSVPAGKYANESLISLGIKTELESKLIYAKDVKEVLAWVASGNAEAGFIYKSDAISSDDVKIIEELPDDSHSSINYVAGVIKDSKNKDIATDFEDYLFSSKGKEILEKYGYKTI